MSLYCNAAFKIRKKHHLIHITIKLYPISKTIYSLISVQRYIIFMLPALYAQYMFVFGDAHVTRQKLKLHL